MRERGRFLAALEYKFPHFVGMCRVALVRSFLTSFGMTGLCGDRKGNTRFLAALEIEVGFYFSSNLSLASLRDDKTSRELVVSSLPAG